MSSNLDQLKKFVLEGGWDEDSKKQVAEIEDELHLLAMAEKLASNPVIQKFLDYLKLQSDNCTYLLTNERKLTELERLNLFDKREMCDRFTNLFTGEEKTAINETINQLLTQVKNA